VKQLGLLVRSVCLDDAADLVNLAVYLPDVDKVREFLVDEIGGDAERASHVVDCHRLEGLQVLTVGDQAHLFDKVVRMSLQVLVRLDLIDDLYKGLEEGFVVTVVKRFQVLSEEGDVADDGEDVGRVNDFLADDLALLGNHGGDDCVEHEVAVAHELNASEGSDGAHEEFCCALQVADEHAVDALEDLELVLFIPVGALVNQRLALSDILLEGVDIELLDVHEHDLEEDLHLLGGPTGLGIGFAEDTLGLWVIMSLLL